MPIDVFSKDEFVSVIQPFFERPVYMFKDRGEWVAYGALDEQAGITIRSSIPAGDEYSAGTGANSIRFFLVTLDNELLATLDNALYITRLPGWQGRVGSKINELKKVRLDSGDCPDCGKPMAVRLSHTAKNPNRLFASCKPCDKFMWIDQPRWRPTISKPLDVPKSPSPPSSDFTDTSIEEILNAVKQLDNSDDTPADLPAEDDLGLDFVSPDDLTSALAIPSEIVVSYTPNEEQREVIESDVYGASRVNAGPGSGKTFVLSHRYNFLVQNGIDPGKIVAVTFGSRAAAELKERIFRVNPSLVGTPAESLITTIHAFCFRSLKSFGIISSNIQPTVDKMAWKERAIVETKLSELYPKGDNVPLWREAWDVVQSAKMHGYRPGVPTKTFCFNIGLDDFHADKMMRLRDMVWAQMQSENLITFTDMLYLVDILLQDNVAFLSNMRNRFSHGILDEGQDTSKQAMRILSTICNENFMIVGDTDQLLYRFTGAAPEENLQEGFEKIFPNGKTFMLGRNYRSTRQIVQAATMIKNNYNRYGGPYGDRYLKDLIAVKDEIGEIHHIQTESPMDDAGQAADLIMQIQNDHNDLSLAEVAGKFFLTVRTRVYSVYLEDALARSGIPYVNATGMSFWNLPHVKKLLSFLRLCEYPDDRSAWEGVYQIPSKDWKLMWKNHPDYGKYVTSHRLAKTILGDYPTFRSFESDYNRDRLNWKYRDAAEDIISIMQGVEYALRRSPADAVKYLVTDVFKKYLTHEDGQDAVSSGEGGKIEELDAVAEMASLFDSASDFLAYVEKVLAAAESASKGDWSNKAVIATIHKLKGLERDYVIVCGCSEFDKVEAKTVTSLMPHTFTFQDPPAAGIFPPGGGCRLEDERCLFYVAVTRAKEAAFILSPGVYRNTPMEPSRFVYELMEAVGMK